MPSYKKTLHYLYGLEKFGIMLGLERINAILKLIDEPHRKFPIVHVAGTNGKGSVSAMSASILQEAGYKVGLYTSPHLVRFNERISVNGKEITNKKIVELTEKIKERVRGQGSGVMDKGKDKLAPTHPSGWVPALPLAPTFFEFTTAMAFLYFAEENVDIAVVEVGLGGRLDATNVCKPLVSIITNVSREHEGILGKGIKKIAVEKAGIVKKGSGVRGQGSWGKLQYNGLITGCTQPSVLDVIHKVCKERNTTFYRLGKDFSIVVHKDRFDFHGRKWRIKNLKTNLVGRHQYKNAALALAAIEAVDGKRFKVSEDAVRKGLESVKLQGRFQIVSKKPTIVFDCAHNPDGAKVLKETLTKEFFGKRLILVFGVMADKDIKGILSHIAAIADVIIGTVPRIDRAANKEMLLDIAKPFARNIKVVEDVKMAYDFAKSIANKQDVICVTGSFYTVGEALKTCHE